MDSKVGTRKHQQAVNEIGQVIIQHLIERFEKHDQSKLESPEVEILDGMPTPPQNYSNGSWGEGLATGGLDEASLLKRRFLTHHYKVNRHHPEHFENGIDGMTLIDLVEMYVDWCASSMRGDD